MHGVLSGSPGSRSTARALAFQIHKFDSRIIRSSVSRLSRVVANVVVTVVFTTFAAPFCIAAERTRLPRRFLTLSGHFLEMSRLAAPTDTLTCRYQSFRNEHTLARQHQSPSSKVDQHLNSQSFANSGRRFYTKPHVCDGRRRMHNVVPAILSWLPPDLQS